MVKHQMKLPDLLARLTDSQPPVTDADPVKTTCAWCPGFKPGASRNVSHGMCQRCVDRFAADPGGFRRPVGRA